MAFDRIFTCAEMKKITPDNKMNEKIRELKFFIISSAKYCFKVDFCLRNIENKFYNITVSAYAVQSRAYPVDFSQGYRPIPLFFF